MADSATGNASAETVTHMLVVAAGNYLVSDAVIAIAVTGAAFAGS